VVVAASVACQDSRVTERQSSPFLVAVDDEQLRRERAKARELRDSQWWKRRRSTGVCHYCGKQVGAKALTMDHLVPIIRGGRSTHGNVVPACKPCNDAKKHSLPIEWQPAARDPDGGGDR
jgi:5-methylcytosine-specific restriction enzyme A